VSELSELIRQILAFRDERNWKQFHTPRNLAAAIAIESGELQELMLWRTDEDVRDFRSSPEGKKKLSAEIADVLIYGLLLCDAISIDAADAIREKIIQNEQKYPVDLSRNRSTKYNELK
jgi:dCTP diphosphatase